MPYPDIIAHTGLSLLGWEVTDGFHPSGGR